ncbi:MAG: lamin tail domain-containing protein [Patescibacteria group bacterium]|nr:lamin tail domain-containing protein [Patescibacteria group bacterium]
MPKIILSALLCFITFFINPTLSLANNLLLNEILPHPSAGADWIEIYNAGDSTLDLTNWGIADSTSDIKNLTGNIPPHGFVVLEVTNRLNNSGDSVYLKDSNKTVIDSYTYTNDPGMDKSFVRIPDGGNWTIIDQSSKGNPNPTFVDVSPTDQQSPLLPSPTPTDFPTPSPTKTQPDFSISSVPSSINSSQSFTANIQIHGWDRNSRYYLKGAFLKTGFTNYFGKTKVSGTWIKNGQTYSSQFPFMTDSLGSWNGSLEVMPDQDDSGFMGSGDYIFKVGYYSDNGSGPTWGNIFNIHIEDDRPSPTNSPTPTISPTEPISPALKKIDQSTPSSGTKIKIPQDLLASSSSVAGVSIKNNQQPKIKNEEKPNFLSIIGVVIFLVGTSCLFYYYKKR